MAITSQWQSASDEDWALALAREAVIRPLTDQPEVTEGLLVTASAELGISRSMVYRLVAKFRKRPQVSSLLPGKRGRKASARTLSVAAEAIVRDAITDVYLQPEKPRLSDLLKEIQRQCQRKGWMPNFRTVKRRVEMSRRTRTVWIRSVWAFVFQTHCTRHRTPLLETCGVCFIEDPLAITNPPVRDKSLQLASCWNCGSSLLLYDPEPPASPMVAEIIDLESAILTAVLGDRLILAGPDGFAPKRSPRSLDS